MQYSDRDILSIETLRPLEEALKNEPWVISDLSVKGSDRSAVSTSLKPYLGRRSINTLIFRHPSHREIMLFQDYIGCASAHTISPTNGWSIPSFDLTTFLTYTFSLETMKLLALTSLALVASSAFSYPLSLKRQAVIDDVTILQFALTVWHSDLCLVLRLLTYSTARASRERLLQSSPIIVQSRRLQESWL